MTDRREFIARMCAGPVGGMVLLGAGAAQRAAGEPDGVPASARRPYRCLYNIELLIVCWDKNPYGAKIAALVEKLKDTDVDAIMCCPQAWRTNLYPSEVDPAWKQFTHVRDLPKFPTLDNVMEYIHDGGDMVRDTLDACRRIGRDCFISYRMNDFHNVEDKDFPTHNAFWREHPEYWLGDSDRHAYGLDDNRRLFNYMLEPVRDHYFAILEELCTGYDVDGLELDFQRCCRFFHDAETEAGVPVMTAFVRRVRSMLDHVGRERGKALQLCVRVPPSLAACRKAGLDLPGWDASGLIEMVNVAPQWVHTPELGIEEFKGQLSRARVYGELNYLTHYVLVPDGRHLRYTTFEMHRSAALSHLTRGADGVSVFNYDYALVKRRLDMVPGLVGITDPEFLKTTSKDYPVYPYGAFREKPFPAQDEQTLRLYVADDTRQISFERAVLRVETEEDCTGLRIGVWLNGTPLEACEMAETELFPPVERTPAYPAADTLRFYAVPLDAIRVGYNDIAIRNLDREKASCTLFSLELALYRSMGD